MIGRYGHPQQDMSPIREDDDRDSEEYQLMPITWSEPEVIMPVENWVDTDVEIILDSGACSHVIDAEDAPGYRLEESPGSRRGATFVVGNGERVPNEGQVNLRLESTRSDGSAAPVISTFQVAEVMRPIMSVSRICAQGFTCVFDKDGGRVLDKDQKEVCYFKEQQGLYATTMKLKKPEPFTRQAP